MAQELVEFSFQPKTLDEAMKFAELVAKSDLVPKDYKGNPGNVLIAIQWGHEVGLKPLQALQNIAVVNGRPSMYGDAPLALVKNSGLLEDFREDFDERTLTAICTAKRKGQPTVITASFSKADAEKAALWSKQNYQQYPKRMLKMRARAFVLRDGFPDVLKGIAIGEEQEDQDLETTADPLPSPPEPPRRLSAGNGAQSPDPIEEWAQALTASATSEDLREHWDRLTIKGGFFETLTGEQKVRLTMAKDKRKMLLASEGPSAHATAR